MVRPLTSAMLTEVLKDATRPIQLVELDMPSGVLRFTDRDVDALFSGNTYLANATLLDVSSTQESKGLQANGIVITLAFTAIIKTAFLTDFALGRRARLWWALEDTEGAPGDLLVSPEPIKGGFIERVTFDDDDQSPSIEVSIEGRARDLRIARDRRWNTETQIGEFAGDLGFRYVEAIQDFLLRADNR